MKDEAEHEQDHKSETFAADLAALREQFARTDFNYSFSDDYRARNAGQEQVRLAKEAFEAFAARSSSHASAASAEWDKATDIIRQPKAYVRESERTHIELTAERDAADQVAIADRTPDEGSELTLEEQLHHADELGLSFAEYQDRYGQSGEGEQPVASRSFERKAAYEAVKPVEVSKSVTAEDRKALYSNMKGSVLSDRRPGDEKHTEQRQRVPRGPSWDR